MNRSPVDGSGFHATFKREIVHIGKISTLLLPTRGVSGSGQILSILEIPNPDSVQIFNHSTHRGVMIPDLHPVPD